MAKNLIELPDVNKFTGLYFDPVSMMVTLGYEARQTPEAICQLKIPFEASSRLAAWLVEVYEKTTGDQQLGQRINAVKLLGDTPQGNA